MFEKKIKVDNELWKKIKKDAQTKNDRVALKRVFQIYFKSKDALEENTTLKRELSESKKAIQEKHTETDNLYKEIRKTVMERSKLMKRYDALKRKYDELQRSMKPPKEEKTYKKEKVVYKVDPNALDGLKAKNEKLRQEIWKLRSEIEKSKSWKDKYDELMTVVKNWKRENMAVLIKGGPTCNIEAIDIEIVDSRTYYQFKANPEKYLKKNNRCRYLLKEFVYRSVD